MAKWNDTTQSIIHHLQLYISILLVSPKLCQLTWDKNRTIIFTIKPHPILTNIFWTPDSCIILKT